MNWNRSRTKKLLCRLFGERRGGVMMEYVILAVLIAAAAVVAVAMFGRTIVNMFNVAGKGATGQHTQSATARNTAKTEQSSGHTQAQQHEKKMHE